MDLSWLLALGLTAGILQILGYYFYLKDETIDPNPVTWFMFAYGTAILTVLEWDKQATVPELILPVVCAILAIVVSYRCWKLARKLDPSRWWPNDWWPEDKYEKASFVSDIFITVGYLGIWILTISTLLDYDQKETGVFLFLLLSNISTLPAFYPIISTTIKNPKRENWLPWIVWGLAYALLGVVTYFTHGQLWHILMLYPLSNAVLHTLVGILAINKIGSYFQRYRIFGLQQ